MTPYERVKLDVDGLLARLKGELGLWATASDFGTDGRVYGMDVLVPRANDSLEFAVAIAPPGSEFVVEAHLGWQATAETIATWQLPDDGRLEDGLARVMAAAFNEIEAIIRENS